MPLFEPRWRQWQRHQQARASKAEQPTGPDQIDRLAEAADPMAAVLWFMSAASPRGEDQYRRMPLGNIPKGVHYVQEDSWWHTDPDTHLLALGPPRSHAGKTASVIIPTILSALGPVVAASTKQDVLDATAMARAQRGELWCYAPDGNTPIPMGVTELRWSPLQGAHKWDVADAVARDMTGALASDNNDVRDASHWQERAKDMLGPIFYWAARNELAIEEVLAAVHNHAVTLPGIVTWLKDHSSGDANSLMAAGALNSVVHAGQQEKGSIASMAARALSVYHSEAARKSTRKPNFDPDAFVRGGAAGVRADTLYLTSAQRNQGKVAPLIVALLGQIRDAVYRRDRLVGGRKLVPVVFALDELYGLAPIKDLPEMLTDGGSQGLLIAAAVQDLTLIKSRWPTKADSFLTLFSSVLVFPGIKDVRTLEAVSKVVGNHDRETRSQTTGGPHPTTTTGTHREPIYDPAVIGRGVMPGFPNVLLWLYPGGWAKVGATPYWRTTPWLYYLRAALERACSGLVPEWRFWEAVRTGAQPDVWDRLPDLPRPNLDWCIEHGVQLPDAPPRLRRCAAALSAAFRELDSRAAQPPRPAIYELWPGWTDRRYPYAAPELDAGTPPWPPRPLLDPQEVADAASDSWDDAAGEPSPEAQEFDALVLAIEAEKLRRRRAGDADSVVRFDEALEMANQESGQEPGLSTSAARAGATWWDMYPAQPKRLIEEFLGGCWEGATVAAPEPPEEVAPTSPSAPPAEPAADSTATGDSRPSRPPRSAQAAPTPPPSAPGLILPGDPGFDWHRR